MVLKGQFYSMIAIVVIIPILIFITGTMVSIQETKFSATEKIISDQLHIVEKSIEEDFHKGVEISIRRAFLALIDNQILNGSYYEVDESGNIIMELLENGTIYGEPNFIMTNNTLNEWKSRILEVSTGFDVDFTFTYPTGLFDGTEIYGDYGMDIEVSDKFGISKINKTNVRKEYRISIEDLEDPIFPLGTNGLVRRKFKMYPYDLYVARFNSTPGNFANTGVFKTGNMTTDTGTPSLSKVLLINDVSGYSGWGCIIGETGIKDPSQDCYMLVDSLSDITDAMNSVNNYSEILIDDQTQDAWFLPFKMGVLNKTYFLPQGNATGPNIFDRCEKDFEFSGNPQMFTFVNADELLEAGLQVEEDMTMLAWWYFWGEGVLGSGVGYPIRGEPLPSWFVLDNYSAEGLGIQDILRY